MSAAPPTSRGRGKVVPRRALPAGASAPSAPPADTSLVIRPASAPAKEDSLPPPTYPAFLEDERRVDRLPATASSSSRQHHADLGVYLHLQDSTPAVIEQALSCCSPELRGSSATRHIAPSSPLHSMLTGLLHEVETAGATPISGDDDPPGGPQDSRASSVAAAAVLCCTAACPRFLHLEALKNILNDPSASAARRSTTQPPPPQPPAAGQSLEHALLLAAATQAGGSSNSGRGNNSADAGYHVRSHETRTLRLPLHEFAERVKCWRDSRLLLQVDIFDFQFRRACGDVCSHAAAASSGVQQTAAQQLKVQFCSPGTGASASESVLGCREAEARMEAHLAPLWHWLLHGFGAYFSAHAAPCPFAGGRVSLDWCSNGCFQPARYELQDRLMLQVSGVRRALLLPPSASLHGLAPFPSRHGYDRYSAPILAATARPPLSADATGPSAGEVPLAAVLDIWPDLLQVKGRVAVLRSGDVLWVPAGWSLHLEAWHDAGAAAQALEPATGLHAQAAAAAAGAAAASGAEAGDAGNVALVVTLVTLSHLSHLRVPPTHLLELQLSRMVERWVEAETGPAGVRTFLMSLADHLEHCSSGGGSSACSPAVPAPPPPLPQSSSTRASPPSSAAVDSGDDRVGSEAVPADAPPQGAFGEASPVVVGPDKVRAGAARSGSPLQAHWRDDPCLHWLRGAAGSSAHQPAQHSHSGRPNRAAGASDGGSGAQGGGHQQGAAHAAAAAAAAPFVNLGTPEGYRRARLAQMIVDQATSVVSCRLSAEAGQDSNGGGTLAGRGDLKGGGPHAADGSAARPQKTGGKDSGVHLNASQQADRGAVLFLRSMCAGRLVPTDWVNMTCGQDALMLRAARAAPVRFEDPRGEEERRFPELFRLQAAQKEALPRRYLPLRPPPDGGLLSGAHGALPAISTLAIKS